MCAGAGIIEHATRHVNVRTGRKGGVFCDGEQSVVDVTPNCCAVVREGSKKAFTFGDQFV